MEHELDNLLDLIDASDSVLHDAMEAIDEVRNNFSEGRKMILELYRSIGYNTIENYAYKEGINLTEDNIKSIIKASEQMCNDQGDIVRWVDDNGLKTLLPEFIIKRAIEEL